jgi:hypothetical protein
MCRLQLSPCPSPQAHRPVVPIRNGSIVRRDGLDCDGARWISRSCVHFARGRKYVVRPSVLHRHADGSMRSYRITIWPRTHRGTYWPFARAAARRIFPGRLARHKLLIQMAPSPNHTRRLLQFSLGTMLLGVTLFAVWLEWELSVVRARKHALAAMEASGAFEIRYQGLSVPGFPHVVQKGSAAWRPSWIRRMMGDERLGVMVFRRPLTEADLENVSRFPEADFMACY